MKRVVAALVLLVVLVVSPAFAAQKAAPTVSITSPEPGLTVATDNVVVTATCSTSDGAGLKLVELLVDGAVVQSVSYDPPESSGLVALTWEASGYLDGKHRLVMRVTDSNGQVGKAAIPVILTRNALDTQPIRLTAPGPGAKVAGRVDVTADAPDPALVKYVIFLVDNVFKGMSNIRPFVYHWDTSGYLNGLHRLQVKAYLTDGGEALSRSLEVLVDNPSGATALKPPAALAAPKPASAPTRAAETVLPPPVRTETATPFSKTLEVSEAAVGAPGTAPYVNAEGELVQPPSVVAAARVDADSTLPVATVPDAAEAPAAPTAAAASVTTPPAPVAEPQRTSAESSLPSAPATDQPAAAKTVQTVAPVKVAALPVPASIMARSPALGLGAVAAAETKPVGTGRSSSSPTALTTPPVPKPTAVAATPASKPVVATAAAKPTPVAAAPRQIAMVPPKPAAAVAPAKPTPVAATVAAKPVVIAPAPKQIALLPPKPMAQKPAPKLTAAPAPNTGTHVVQSGDCLSGIAAIYQITPYQLAAANNLQAPYLIRPGQRLIVPNSNIYVNGEPVNPFVIIIDPHTGRQDQSVAFRQVVERVGGTVDWDQKTHQAKGDARGHHVVVTIGDIKAVVDGKQVGMTVSTLIWADRTLVPARFLGDAFDLTVTYDRGVTRIAAK